MKDLFGLELTPDNYETTIESILKYDYRINKIVFEV